MDKQTIKNCFLKAAYFLGVHPEIRLGEYTDEFGRRGVDPNVGAQGYILGFCDSEEGDFGPDEGTVRCMITVRKPLPDGKNLAGSYLVPTTAVEPTGKFYVRALNGGKWPPNNFT